MSNLYNSNSSFDGDKTKEVDNELQEFILKTRQVAQLNAQIHEFNDICWEKCMDKPGSKLDARTETCLNNCVDRFLDVTLLIANRFTQLLEKSAGI